MMIYRSLGVCQEEKICYLVRIKLHKFIVCVREFCLRFAASFDKWRRLAVNKIHFRKEIHTTYYIYYIHYLEYYIIINLEQTETVITILDLTLFFWSLSQRSGGGQELFVSFFGRSHFCGALNRVQSNRKQSFFS